MKKISTILMTIVITFVMCACGSKQETVPEGFTKESYEMGIKALEIMNQSHRRASCR